MKTRFAITVVIAMMLGVLLSRGLIPRVRISLRTPQGRSSHRAPNALKTSPARTLLARC